MTAPVFAPSRLPLAWRWLGRWVWNLEHAFERARAAANPQDSRLRIAFVMFAFALAFMVVAAGATRQALFSGRGGTGSAVAPADARIDLTDRNGALLAADLPHFALYVDPREVWDIPATREALRRLVPGLQERRLTRLLEGGRRGFLVGGLTPEQRRAIHDLGLPGLTFENDERRVYPLGRTAAHLIGFADSGGVGLAGVERAFDEDIRTSVAGDSLALSIDLRIQAALEDELHKATAEFNPIGSVGIVTNVRTGEILGMASWPDFDPNEPGASTENAKLNRAGSAVFEMGSTFKAFTVAIGLDVGVADMNTTFDAREPFKLGYRTIQDYHAARKVLTLTEVFQHSSNIGTAKLALGIGPERMQRYFEGMGLTRPAQVDLRESATPITPRKWDLDAVASTSFGHGINVSPLALTAAYGAALNGGVVVPLTVRKLEPGAKVEGRRVFSPQTSERMLEVMRANVTGGSGGSADAPGLSVGGKTGTGEKYDPAIRRYSTTKQVSSFAAVFPTAGGPDVERYFVLILMDEPKPSARTYGYSTGGWVAAPAAGRVIDRIAPFLGVRRDALVQAVASNIPGAIQNEGR